MLSLSRDSALRHTKGRPAEAGIEHVSNVPYLFSVRNMFFLTPGYWPVFTPNGLAPIWQWPKTQPDYWKERGMFSAILGLALFAGGAGALFSLRGTAAGPHRLLRSAVVEEVVTLSIVLLVVSGSMLLVYGLIGGLL